MFQAHRVHTLTGKLTTLKHSFNGTPWNDKDDESETWMRASDARHQQAGITAGYMRPYPSPFGNKENLQFSSPGSSVMKDGSTGWLHNPLIPGQKETWVKGSGRPGAVRSFYTKGQPADFDVAYHDKKAGVTGGGPGVFVMANYHAALPPPLQPLGPVPQGPRRGSYH